MLYKFSIGFYSGFFFLIYPSFFLSGVSLRLFDLLFDSLTVLCTEKQPHIKKAKFMYKTASLYLLAPLVHII